MDGVPDWLMYVGAIVLMALIFGGVNIGAILLVIGGIAIVGQIFIFGPMDKRDEQKRKNARKES